MISVVHRPEFLVTSFLAHSAGFGKFRHAAVKTSLEFLLRHTADVSELRVHGDVVQVIQPAEYAHLAEFGDICQKGEADEFVLALDDAVESLEFPAEFFHQIRGVHVVYDRLLIFIDVKTTLLPVLR